MQSSRERESTRANWAARVLATLALGAALLALLLVVASSRDRSGGEGEAPGSPTETTTAETCQPDAEKAVEAGYYVLEAGEDLSVVAEKTCLELSELLKLNSDLDPQQLEVSSCIDLVPDGCKVLAEG